MFGDHSRRKRHVWSAHARFAQKKTTLLASFVVRSGAEVSKAFRFFYITYMIVDVILRLQGIDTITGAPKTFANLVELTMTTEAYSSHN